MARGAKLTSIDAVPEMSAAIERFRGEAAAALEELDMEIRRAVAWVQHDRLEHWSREIRRGWDRISESRVQLQQAMAARRVGDEAASCIDEKKAVERAKKRLELAQDKLEISKHWARTVEKAVNEFIGSRTALATWLDCEAPKAVAALARIADQIDTYLNIQPDATLELMNLAKRSEFNVARQDGAQNAKSEENSTRAINVSAPQANEPHANESTSPAPDSPEADAGAAS